MKRASQPIRSTRACALALALAGVAACSWSQEGVMPPGDTFFFPSSGIMPDARWLYVANSNADLRYNDGTLVMVDTNAVFDARDITSTNHPAWGPCPQADYVNPLPRSDAQICCWDALDSNILNCDERLFVQSDSTVRIGSFAAGMAWQNYCAADPCSDPTAACPYDPSAGRLFIGVRGDTSLTWVDVAPDPSHPTFHCREDGAVGTLAECTQKVVDTASQLNSEKTDPSAPAVTLPDEPYVLETDPAFGLLYVGHLVGNTSVVDSGGISLFDISGTKAPSGYQFPPAPNFIAPFPSPFPANSAGSFGVTAITAHPSYNGGSGHEIFVSSRYLPLVQSMVPFEPGDPTKLTDFACGDRSDLVVIPAGETLSSGLTGTEMRGVAFLDPPAGNPQRVFALQRVPPTLVTFDITQNESGAVIPVVSSQIETCSSPTFLYATKDPLTGATRRLYVNCFDTGEIYVFNTDPPELVTSFVVARGPAGMVFDPTRPLAYVLDFSHNDVAVVDLTPGSPTEDHVIQRLGFPSISPR